MSSPFSYVITQLLNYNSTRQRKSQPIIPLSAKLEIAARLRRDTTPSLKAIAARVRLGTSKTVNAKLHKHMPGHWPVIHRNQPWAYEYAHTKQSKLWVTLPRHRPATPERRDERDRAHEPMASLRGEAKKQGRRV